MKVMTIQFKKLCTRALMVEKLIGKPESVSCVRVGTMKPGKVSDGKTTQTHFQYTQQC